MLIRHILFTIIFISYSLLVNGQDIHYSQYFNHYPSQNPIHAGLYSGKHRITANYRNQWQTVPVPYLTLSMFYDTKFRLRGSKDYFGVGIGFDYDKAGDSELSLTSLNVSLNYAWSIDKSNQFILGLSPSVGQRRLSSEKLRWNNQWNGDKYDPALSSKENFNLTGTFFLDLAAGAGFQHTFTKRSKILLGGTFFHVLEPNQTFYGINQTSVKLPIRKVYHANIDIGIGSFFDFMLRGQYQEQQEYNEKLASGLFRLYLNKNPGVKLNLLLGCGVRLDDAFFPMIGFEYKDWMVSGSYDINTSDFKTATNRRGGLELAVQYVFRSVEPVGIFRKCPIY